MRKTDKKLDKVIREALTEACEITLQRGDGFQWLTHEVNYNRFPQSLSVLCVYATNADLKAANTEALIRLISQQLEAVGVALKNPRQHVSFDTEENRQKIN